MRQSRLLLLAIILVCGLVSGCGGSRDKGKQQDYDRPKISTEKK